MRASLARLVLVCFLALVGLLGFGGPAAAQEGEDPLLLRLAESNSELAGELAARAGRLEELERQQERIERLADWISVEHQEAAETLENGGLSQGLGPLLLEQRDSLPDLQTHRRETRALQDRIAAALVERLSHRSESRRLDHLDQAMEELESGFEGPLTPQSRERLRTVLSERKKLLERALEADDYSLERLRQLDAASQRLLETANAYNAFLDEHLIWLRSGDETRPEDLLAVPAEVEALLSRSSWSGLWRSVGGHLRRSPLFWLALLVASGLLWGRRALRQTTVSSAQVLGDPAADRFSATLRALIGTALTAAPLSLVLAVTGSLVSHAPLGGDLAQRMGLTLVSVAAHLYLLRFWSELCIPGGVAEAHFRWPAHGVGLLKRAINQLTWITIPTLLVVRLAIDLSPATMGGALARLGFAAYSMAITLYLYRLMAPRRGILSFLQIRPKGEPLTVFRLALLLLVTVPLTLTILTLTGFLYTADTLYYLFEDTLWLLSGLVLLYALAVRWLGLAQRRLAWEDSQRRHALVAESGAKAERRDDDLEARGEGSDLEELGEDTRSLLDVVMIIVALIGSLLIWSPVLPALGIFDEVTLWHETAIVEGEETRIPVTLASLVLALFFAYSTVVLVKRLPALLEILLRRRLDLTAGTRYAITTLTTYAVIALGVVLVSETLGAQWSQVQWLVAALGVGLGFGMQEIVANFISGLILLYERSIRVGDIVTVGSTDGVVTKIRIRATTVRDWDRKELLVPNKELITGSVVNWSLSDHISRVVIEIGVTHGSDIDRALALMKEAAEEHEDVLEDPPPSVSFDAFDENTLRLALRVVVDSIDNRTSTRTALLKSIIAKFEREKIKIAFPQQDVHLDTREPLRIILDSQEEGDRGSASPSPRRSQTS